MRMSVDDISVIGRNTSGVKLMNVSQSDEIRLTGLARIWTEFLVDEVSEGSDASEETDHESGAVLDDMATEENEDSKTGNDTE